MAAIQGKSPQRFRNQPPKPTISSQKLGHNDHKLAKPQQFKVKKKDNPNVNCTYCGKIGHIQKDCYRHIGFPDDF